MHQGDRGRVVTGGCFLEVVIGRGVGNIKTPAVSGCAHGVVMGGHPIITWHELGSSPRLAKMNTTLSAG